MSIEKPPMCCLVRITEIVVRRIMNPALLCRP
jgi:hypothetical protein